MKTRLRFDSADWTRDRNGYGITLYTKDAAAAQGFMDSFIEVVRPLPASNGNPACA